MFILSILFILLFLKKNILIPKVDFLVIFIKFSLMQNLLVNSTFNF